jgi:hypothetical protein
MHDTESMKISTPIYRQVQSLKMQLVGNDIDWLGDFSPAIQVSRRSYGKEKTSIARILLDEPGSVRMQYLSESGEWENALGRNIFDFENAHALALETMNALQVKTGLDASSTVVEETILQETICAMPEVLSWAAQHCTLRIKSTPHGYEVRNYYDQYLSQSGQWHMASSTERFIRNHYFAYTDAIERALEALPHVMFPMRNADGVREDITVAEYIASATE